MISEVERANGDSIKLEHDGSDFAIQEIDRMRAYELEARRLIAEGKPALYRLMPIAELGDSGQSRYIAAFLLGLYNGPRFPFDLTELRCLDSALQDDCLTVLKMDARACLKEVHCYFNNGGERFENMAKRWSLK